MDLNHRPQHYEFRIKREDVMAVEREQAIQLLREHNALLVHFASITKMSNTRPKEPEPYPDRLLRILESNLDRNQKICTSTVMPGDKFPTSKSLDTNATGCIGVILVPNSDISFCCADPADCGSEVKNDVRQCKKCVSSPHECTFGELENAIINRPTNEYNEWIISDYETLGLFMMPDFCVPLPDSDADEKYRFTDLIELNEDFGGYDIYSFHNGEIIIMEGKGPESSVVSHDQIYN